MGVNINKKPSHSSTKVFVSGVKVVRLFTLLRGDAARRSCKTELREPTDQ